MCASALARPDSVKTQALTGTGCAEPANTVRQACGGSESRMTWHRNVRSRSWLRIEQSNMCTHVPSLAESVVDVSVCRRGAAHERAGKWGQRV